MHIRIILAALFFVLVSGCSKGPASGSADSAQARPATAISSFPATLEGKLTIEVTNDWGYFGDIVASGTEHPVAIPASIFEASGVPDGGGMVRVTLESREDVGSSFQYIVSSISKL